MIRTKKNIEKSLKTITEDGELITDFLAVKSIVYKRGVVALSSFGRFIVTNAPLFGKMKILDSFISDDVEKVDFVSEIKMGSPVVHLFMTIKGKDVRFTAFFHPINNDAKVNEMIRTIYEANPSAKPDYLKDKHIFDFLTTKEGTYKLSENEIIVQKYSKKAIENKEIIKIKDITDFDVYPQKMGSKGILYLEVNKEPRVVKFEKTTENHSVATILKGGTSVAFGLGKLCKIFFDSEIMVKVPSYMEENEEELFTEFATKKALGIEEFENKIFRLTDKHIFFLKKEKRGNLSPVEKIPLSSVQSYKKLTKRSENSTDYGLSVTTKDNETFVYWSLDYIDRVLKELNRVFN